MKNTPVAAVIGAGESGMAASELLAKLGVRVICSSQAPIRPADRRQLSRICVAVEEGRHTVDFLARANYVVTSPGIKPSAPPLKIARALNLKVVGEVDVAARVQKAPWVAVTGTNGKTTTSTLLARMIGAARSCDLCGNVGKAFARSILERGPRITRVVEISSFQLHTAEALHPDVAVILNLRPNHLDWHRDLNEYYGDKIKLLRQLKRRGVGVVNADDPELMKRALRTRVRLAWFSLRPLENGFFAADAKIWRAVRGRREEIADISGTRLVGEHNIQNILAATAACLAMGVGKHAVRKGLEVIRPLRHRIEPLGSVRGIAFVNDSKSTTVDSTRAALVSFGQRVVLIAGGRAKEPDFSSIVPVLRERVTGLFLYGEARRLISSQARGFGRTVLVEDFSAAVRRAFHAARPGQTVLLSPMCASFDQFGSYEERGEVFRKIFKELKALHG